MCKRLGQIGDPHTARTATLGLEIWNKAKFLPKYLVKYFKV